MTYQEYLEMGAGEIPELAWNRYSFQAFTFLNRRCFGRLKRDAMPEEAKGCLADLADMQYRQDTLCKSSNGIASESVDGHSVTFEKSAAPADLDRQRAGIVHDWLDGTGLLYAGRG